MYLNLDCTVVIIIIISSLRTLITSLINAINDNSILPLAETRDIRCMRFSTAASDQSSPTCGFTVRRRYFYASCVWRDRCTPRYGTTPITSSNNRPHLAARKSQIRSEAVTSRLHFIPQDTN